MGTVFKIYLPCLARRDHFSAAEEAKHEAVTGGSETILMVEDEQAVPRATTEFLTQQGYKVLEAKEWDGKKTSLRHPLTLHRRSHGEYEWRTISQGNGPIAPETNWLFVSGYAGKTVLDHKVLDVETNFLQKPYSLKQLSFKIRHALNGPTPAGSQYCF